MRLAFVVQRYGEGITGGGAFTGGLASYLQVTLDHCTLAENSAPGSGSELNLYEAQTIDMVAHSVVADTIISNTAATLDICTISDAATFVLSGGGNLSSDHSCDFTLSSDLVDTDPGLLPLADKLDIHLIHLGVTC